MRSKFNGYVEAGVVSDCFGQREFRFASERPRIESTIPKGRPNGYVDVKQAIDCIRPEDFEMRPVLTGFSRCAAAARTQYLFQRSARTSVLVNLGIGGVGAKASEEVFGTYTKLSEQAGVGIYLACVVGIGTFDLPKMMHKCGLIPGCLSMCLFALMHNFLGHRLVEVPSLIEKNLEHYTGIAGALLPRKLYVVTAVLSAASWFAACVFFVRQMAEHFLKVFMPQLLVERDWQWNVLDREGWWVKVLLCVAMLPLALKTTARFVEKAARLGNWCMLLVGVLECACAAHDGLSTNASIPLWGREVGRGVQSLVLPFVGVGMLPYIISDMTSPQKAHKVIDRACVYMAVFYFSIAVIVGWGWGADMRAKDSPITWLAARGGREGTDGIQSMWFTVLAWVCGVAFLVKTMCSFPVFLWPLLREVDALVAFHRDPAVEALLPWALASQQRRKLFVRVAVCSAMIPFELMQRSAWLVVKEFTISAILTTTHLVFPAVASVLAIWTHWKVQEFREGRQERIARITARPYTPTSVFFRLPSSDVRVYFGGSFACHLTAAVVNAAVLWMFSISSVMMFVCSRRVPETLGLSTCPRWMHEPWG